MERFISRVAPIDDMDIKRVNRKAREVTAYATFFDQPTEIRDKHGHYWEQINRTSFNRAISYGIERVQVFYNHGYDLSGRPNILGAVPIASPQEIKADGHGLLTVSRYNDGEVADAVLAAWEGGQIKGQSFSGRVYQDRVIGQKEGLDHVERTMLGLKEYGPTHSPAYDGDGLVMIRSQDELADLVRSLIEEIALGTQQPTTEASSTVTPRAPGASGEDTDSGVKLSGHNSRVARARAARMKLEHKNA
jgi:HK97 family phage prohead protease